MKIKIDLFPQKCNLCGGKVIYTSNAEIYGREYGSGKCYICKNCGSYVGTHKPRPKEALGILANERMRKGKMCCHDIFDGFWKGKKNQRLKRQNLYIWLSKQMDIDVEYCHFGYFDIDQLIKAYRILKDAESKQMKFDKNGQIYFE